MNVRQPKILVHFLFVFTRDCCKFSDMSIEQIAAEALRLEPKQRALLAQSLWESLSDPFQEPAELADAEVLALARERDRQIETGEVKPVGHEEMMSRLR